jgi:hypothetical protein
MFAILLALLAPVAHAASVTFCFVYNVDLDDAEGVGDDYINDNAVNYPARGTWARVKETVSGAGKFTGYTNDGSTATPGCTPALTLTHGTTYTITVRSENRVRGNYVYLYDDDTSPSAYLFSPSTTYNPPSAGETKTYIIPTQDWWSNEAVAAWAFWQNDTGARNPITMYMSGCGLLIDGTCCDAADKVFIGNQATKAILAHNLGHCVWTASGGPNLAVDYPSDLTVLEEAPCDIDYSTHDYAHYMLSKEFQASNIWEGWAHFYWANTFNDGTQWAVDDQCYVEYYDWPLDWDQDNNNDPTEYGPILNCAGSNDVEDEEDYYWDYCSSGTSSHNKNVGVAFDWMRFFWDYAYGSTSSVTTTYSAADLLDQVLNSDPASWTIKGFGSGATYPLNEFVAVCTDPTECTKLYEAGVANGIYQ